MLYAQKNLCLINFLVVTPACFWNFKTLDVFQYAQKQKVRNTGLLLTPDEWFKITRTEGVSVYPIENGHHLMEFFSVSIDCIHTWTCTWNVEIMSDIKASKAAANAGGVKTQILVTLKFKTTPSTQGKHHFRLEHHPCDPKAVTSTQNQTSTRPWPWMRIERWILDNRGWNFKRHPFYLNLYFMKRIYFVIIHLFLTTRNSSV